MDLLALISAIFRRRLLAALMVALAVLAAVASAYKLPSMEQRSIAVGAATSQILVDSNPSTLVAGAGTDTIAALGSRARVYAQYLSSRDAIAKISSDTGIPRFVITARGPFSQGTGIKNYEQQPAESRAKDLVDEGKQYRLVFEAQEEVPIITVYATGPSAAAALNLAKASFATLKGYVADLQRQGILAKAQQASSEPDTAKEDKSSAPADDPDTTIVVRQLGEPEGGTVGGRADKAMMLLAFLGAFGIQAFFVGLAISVREQRRTPPQIEDLPAAPAYIQPEIAEHEQAEAQRSRLSRAGYLR